MRLFYLPYDFTKLRKVNVNYVEQYFIRVFLLSLDWQLYCMNTDPNF